VDREGFDRWLDDLGYSAFPDQLRRAGAPVSPEHPYAPELNALFDPAGEVRASAVFEVNGVPAVCLIAGDPEAVTSDALAALRARVWNQGLISVVLVLGADAVRAMPAVPKVGMGDLQSRNAACLDSAVSAYGVQSAALMERYPTWFEPNRRVDRELIQNLSRAVDELTPLFASAVEAQYLVAQVLFVSYLEHRGIVQAEYRAKYGVGELHALVRERDGAGVDRLIARLKLDFNGDFLEPTDKSPWASLEGAGYRVLDRFLARTDLTSGQTSLWPYDFRYIPVELLSSIYESFLRDEAAEAGAFYTPRHLANLAVDEALEGLTDDHPVIFDGACGSGILLTTAFRRLLGRAEAKALRRLSLRERSELLLATIYGADIKKAACQVTAFSLYLSLLEDLVPSDIARIREEQHDKLPNLLGKNIFAGEDGDMFGEAHPILQGRMPRPTIVISNPPWREPHREDKPRYETWLETQGLKAQQRQIAVAYAWCAGVLAAPGARLCLIMPASAFLKPTYAGFLSRWLQQVRLHRLFNLSDMRSVLFRAKHAAVVAVADNTPDTNSMYALPHCFDYVTPKADIALAYRRIAIHGSDRRRLPQRRVEGDPAILRTLYWGSEYEVGILDQLCSRGRIGDLVQAKRFVSAKGFHFVDGSKSVSSKPLQDRPFLDAMAFTWSGVALPSSALRPLTRQRVAGLGGHFEVYDGPRVVFADGLSPERRIRASYADSPFSFNNSMTGIRDQENDADLMRFLAAYLCSDLAAYFTLLLAPTAVLERTQVKKAEIGSLPFWLPEHATDPARARKIIDDVSKWVKQPPSEALLKMQGVSASLLPKPIEALIREYFDLDARVNLIADETAQTVLPDVQPSTIGRFPTALQKLPPEGQLRCYATVLTEELERYRLVLKGEGCLSATVRQWRAGGAGYGVVTATASTSRIEAAELLDASIDELLAQLRDLGLLQGLRQGQVATSDVFVRAGNTIVFAKPLIHRLWLSTAALDDAFKLLQYVQRTEVHAHA